MTSRILNLTLFFLHVSPRATICNMGAEMGATTSLFPYTNQMRSYLVATNRSPVAEAADEASAQGFLSADPNCEYDQHLSINLAELEPHINGPHTPDLATPLSKFKAFIEQNKWDDRASACLIGSCTNSQFFLSHRHAKQNIGTETFL
jgi:homoaconitase